MNIKSVTLLFQFCLLLFSLNSSCFSSYLSLYLCSFSSLFLFLLPLKLCTHLAYYVSFPYCYKRLSSDSPTRLALQINEAVYSCKVSGVLEPRRLLVYMSLCIFNSIERVIHVLVAVFV